VALVGRSLPAYLAFSGLLSGCLLFTDPINRAPVVSINGPTTPITRGVPAEFYATVSDDRDNISLLVIEWAEFDAKNQGCDWIDKSAWAKELYNANLTLASTAPYELVASDMQPSCLCVRATDHDGASSQACERVQAAAAQVQAVITEVSSVSIGQPRSLCSEIHLTAENSVYPRGDQIQFDWTFQYPGTDTSGKPPQLGACAGVTANPPELHRCFYAAVPGTYTVSLSVTDTPVGGGAANPVKSPVVSLEIPVSVDKPPCLQRTDPDVRAQRILLARSPDLGSTYQSRTFKVLSAADDCEPYPVPAGSTKQSAQFVWSVCKDPKSVCDEAQWLYQSDTSDSFTVSQAMFPSALPGDTIKVRVEVRDAAVQDLYLKGVGACASYQSDLCCGASACTGDSNECIRWTTWTVQFQP
jgi:hypothetical protein